MTIHNEHSRLKQYVKTLYIKAGKLNLYIASCYMKSNPDVARINAETKAMKQLIKIIEDEIQSLSNPQ